MIIKSKDIIVQDPDLNLDYKEKYERFVITGMSTETLGRDTEIIITIKETTFVYDNYRLEDFTKFDHRLISYTMDTHNKAKLNIQNQPPYSC